MDYSKSSPERLSSRHETAHFRHDIAPTHDATVTQEMFINLKKNYENRSLEAQVRETNNLVDKDQIVQTMRLSKISDEYRRQRVQEIVEESLLSEKESQIEQLNQENAFLKAELFRVEEDNEKLKSYDDEEIYKLSRKYDQLELALENQSKLRLSYEQEAEKLSDKLVQSITQHEEVLKVREHQNNLILRTLNEDNQNLRLENYELQGENEKNNSLLEEMRSDIEVIKREYSRVEGNYQSLIVDHNEITKHFNSTKEKNFHLEAEINRLNNMIKELEQDIGNKENDFRLTKREKEDLALKSDQLQNQMKKVIDQEQKASADSVRDLRAKHKTKNKLLKDKIEEFKQLNEGLTAENTSLKHLVEERKTNYENTIASLQNDMKIIKTEWEKKCQEIELNSQRVAAELKSKHQMQLSQLQSDYQSLLDKKFSELENETSSQMNKSRTVELEVRTQLESRLNQMENDYISKSKHENILTSEIMELRVKHAQNIKELEEKYEQEIYDRIKELAEKKKVEYEALLSSLKSSLQKAEEQSFELRTELKHIADKLAQEKERSVRFVRELEENDQTKKALGEKLEQTNSYINKIKVLYEEEIKKRKALEADANDLQKRYEEVLHKQNQLQLNLAGLQEQNLHLTNSNFGLEERIEELEYYNKHTNNDIAGFKSTVETLSREKEDLISNIKLLSQSLTHESQVTLEKIALVKREESEKLEQETAAKLKMQSQLNQAEHKLSLLTKENAELELKMRGIREENARVERRTFEFQSVIHELETERLKLEATCSELRKKGEKQKQAHKEEVCKLGKLLSLKVTHLKAEFTNLKKSIVLDVQSNKRCTTESFLDLVKFFKDKLRNQADVSSAEHKKEIEAVNQLHKQKIKEIEASYEQQQRLLHEQFEKGSQSHIYAKEQALVKNGELHTENKRLAAFLDSAKDENTKYRTKIERVEADNETLKSFIDEKSKEFTSLQIFVDKEVKRIMDESENLLAASIRQIQDKHRQELGQINELVEEIKESNAVRLKRILDVEVIKLQNCFAEDLESMQHSYELTL